MRLTPPRSAIFAVLYVAACGLDGAPVAPRDPVSPAPAYTTSKLALPGATADGVGMDYLLYDSHTNAIWVPAGNTGAVDVIDVETGKLTQITGFPTQQVERRGTKRVVGPSAATLGDGVVYIGSRGDSTICAVDDVKLVKGTCAKLDAMPDGVAYVSKTREVWVTTPRDKSLRILDATTLVQKARVELVEGPEGFAVDEKRGRFYTNFEDGDSTLAIDLATRQIVGTWKPQCGREGPHGLRLASAEGFLFVACEAQIEVLSVDHDGAVIGSIRTGEGNDDLDYSPTSRQVYVASASGSLTIAAVDGKGTLTVVATVPTVEGSRNGVVARSGKVYVSHGKAGELIVVTPPIPSR